MPAIALAAARLEETEELSRNRRSFDKASLAAGPDLAIAAIDSFCTVSEGSERYLSSKGIFLPAGILISPIAFRAKLRVDKFLKESPAMVVSSGRASSPIVPKALMIIPSLSGTILSACLKAGIDSFPMAANASLALYAYACSAPVSSLLNSGINCSTSFPFLSSESVSCQLKKLLAFRVCITLSISFPETLASRLLSEQNKQSRIARIHFGCLEESVIIFQNCYFSKGNWSHLFPPLARPPTSNLAGEVF